MGRLYGCLPIWKSAKILRARSNIIKLIVWPTVLADCLLLIAIYAHLHPEVRALDAVDSRFIVICILAAVANPVFAYYANQAKRLSTDARIGKAVVVIECDDEEAMIHEVLPVSRSLWTLNGRPAPWRTNKNIYNN